MFITNMKFYFNGLIYQQNSVVDQLGQLFKESLFRNCISIVKKKMQS